jgi:NAD(P)H-hydrate epimerase
MNVSSLTKILDINTEYIGISRELLMENAGKEIALEVEEKNFHSIAIFCGTGNNGGDGFVAARHLASLEKKVKVFSLRGKRTKEAGRNFDILKNLPSIEIFEIRDSSDVEKIKEEKELEKFDVIIDALIGVGIKGKELREPIKSLVDLMNSSKKFIISVDAPTPELKPNLVISLHTKKTAESEDVKVVSIGIPKEAELFSGPGDVFYALPKRTGREHKGDFGRLLVIGGSKNFIGTPWLVAQAALRIGIDLAIIACPKYVAEKIPYDPNLIIMPLSSEDYLKIEDLEKVREINYDSVVIGNGLGTENETKHFVKRFLRETGEKTVVLDADALKLIEGRNLNENIIITPHAGEFKNLFGEYSDDFHERVALVEKFAKKFSSTIVLKGPIDIISNGEQTKLNRSGNPGMTVGGTGDVLAGIVAALSIKTEKLYACSAGTFLCGLSGDLAKEEFGYYFNATDVIKEIPEAIKFCEKFWV